MIKKIIAGFACLFIMATAFAQQQNFVEVIISDSLQIEPDEIVFGVVEEEDYITVVDSSYMDSSASIRPINSVRIVPEINPLTEVRRIIKEMKFDTIASTNLLVSTLRNTRYNPTIYIRLTSIGSLRMLINRLRYIKQLAGGLIERKSSKEAIEMKRLFQRIVQQAKSEAESIAQFAGKKLGTMISVQEIEIGGGWTSYPPLSALRDAQMELAEIEGGKIALFRKYAVRFHWQ